jgi:putative transposase
MANSLKEQRHEHSKWQKTSKTILAPIETAGHSRGTTRRGSSQSGVREIRYPSQPVLSMGEDGREGGVGSTAREETRAQENQSTGRANAGGDPPLEGSDRRNQHRKPGAEKGALEIRPRRRYSAIEKEHILKNIEQTQVHNPGMSLSKICQHLGIARSTVQRWKKRQREGQLADKVVVPHRRAVPPTPEEVASVRHYAGKHPLLGYKRLAWEMVDENVAFLRPWMVYQVLSEAGLLGRRYPAPEWLRRPPEADHPDQRWHTDLMTLYFSGRWFWMVDVLDAYSRYLVHCEVLLTARASVVQLAVQRALDTLDGRTRIDGEPEIVHDRGSQFLSREWREFVRGAEMTDVSTMVHHPQSNGKDERFHRTFREEVSLDPEEHLYLVQDRIALFREYYNFRRPHSALKYLRPIDYYRGDPEARLAERRTKLVNAAENRKLYWISRWENRQPEIQLIEKPFCLIS